MRLVGRLLLIGPFLIWSLDVTGPVSAEFTPSLLAISVSALAVEDQVISKADAAFLTLVLGRELRRSAHISVVGPAEAGVRISGVIGHRDTGYSITITLTDTTGFRQTVSTYSPSYSGLKAGLVGLTEQIVTATEQMMARAAKAEQKVEKKSKGLLWVLLGVGAAVGGGVAVAGGGDGGGGSVTPPTTPPPSQPDLPSPPPHPPSP